MRCVLVLAALFTCILPVANAAEPECKKDYEITYCERFPEGLVQLTADSGFMIWRNLRTEKGFIVEAGTDEMGEIFDNVSVQARLIGDFEV